MTSTYLCTAQVLDHSARDWSTTTNKKNVFNGAARKTAASRQRRRGKGKKPDVDSLHRIIPLHLYSFPVMFWLLREATNIAEPIN